MKIIVSIAALFLNIGNNNLPENCDKIIKQGKLFFQQGSEQPYSGTCMEYYEGDIKKREITYENGVRIKLVKWDKEGKKLEQAMYTQPNVPNLTSWYPNGNIKRKVVYENGNLESSSYYENGKLKSQLFGTTSYGLHDGHYKEWYSNGQIKLEESYKEGKKHGTRKTWYTNGLTMSETTYESGEVIGEKQHYKWKDAGKEYSLKEQKHSGVYEATTGNESVVQLYISYKYKLIENSLDIIHFSVGHGFQDKLVDPIIKNSSKDLVNTYDSKQITKSKVIEKLKAEIMTKAKSTLVLKGIELTDVQITKITIS